MVWWRALCAGVSCSTWRTTASRASRAVTTMVATEAMRTTPTEISSTVTRRRSDQGRVRSAPAAEVAPPPDAVSEFTWSFPIGDEQHRDVVLERTAVVLFGFVHEALGQLGDRGSRGEDAFDDAGQAGDAEPVGAVAVVGVHQSVGVEHEGGSAGEGEALDRRLDVEEHAQRRAGFGLHLDDPPVGAEDQRRRVAEQPDPRLLRAPVDADLAERGVHLVLGAFGDEDLLQGGQQPLLRDPSHDQGPPGDAQVDAERGLVRAVAADVADDEVGGALPLHRVEEVAADQGAFAAGPVEGP